MRKRQGGLALIAAVVVGLGSTGGTALATASDEPTLPTTSAEALGWSAAVLERTPAGGSEGQHELVMVSPEGDQVRVGAVAPKTQVVDVEVDASEVITAPAEWDSGAYTVWNVAAGTSRSVTLDAGESLAFGPGSNLVSVKDLKGTTVGVTTRDASGAQISRFSATSEGGQHVSGGGTIVALSHADGIRLYDTRTGAVRYDVATPEGLYCAPVRLLPGTRLSVDCGFEETTYGYVADLETGALTKDSYLTRLQATTPVSGNSSEDPNYDVYETYLATSDGGHTPVIPEGPWNDGSTAVWDTVETAIGGRGTSLWLTVWWSEDPQTGPYSTSLVRFDTEAKSTVILAGPGGPGDQAPVASVRTIDGWT